MQIGMPVYARKPMLLLYGRILHIFIRLNLILYYSSPSSALPHKRLPKGYLSTLFPQSLLPVTSIARLRTLNYPAPPIPRNWGFCNLGTTRDLRTLWARVNPLVTSSRPKYGRLPSDGGFRFCRRKGDIVWWTRVFTWDWRNRRTRSIDTIFETASEAKLKTMRTVFKYISM